MSACVGHDCSSLSAAHIKVIGAKGGSDTSSEQDNPIVPASSVI